MKSWRGLRQAPRGRGKRRPAQARRNHHAKESLEEARNDWKEIPADTQGIKGTRVAAARLSRRRGEQETTHTPGVTDPQQRKTAVASPKAREESGHPQKRAGTH